MTKQKFKFITPVAIVALSLLMLLGGMVAAEKPGVNIVPKSLLGSYLAGRYASSKNDTQEAATYFRHALEREPHNKRILEQAFLLELMGGDWPRTKELAVKLIQIDPGHPFARLFVGVSDFKNRDFASAEDNFIAGSDGELGDLIGRIARAWVISERGDYFEAIKLLSKKSKTDWVRDYQQYHRALIADVNGKTIAAQKGYERLFRKYHQMVRLVGSYAQFLARNDRPTQALKVLQKHFKQARYRHPDLKELETAIRARIVVKKTSPKSKKLKADDEGVNNTFDGEYYTVKEGDDLFTIAKKVLGSAGRYLDLIELNEDRLEDPDKIYPDQKIRISKTKPEDGDEEQAAEKVEETKAKEAEQAVALEQEQPLPPIRTYVAGATEGLAEIFFSLGDRRAESGGFEDGIIFLQLARYLKPDFAAAHYSLGNLLYKVRKHDRAIVMLNQIKSDEPIWLDAQILKSQSFSGNEQTDKGIDVLASLTSKYQENIDLYNGLAKLHLDKKDYRSAAENYTKAINLLKRPRAKDWFYFYGRGIAYERMKEWPKAEKDFKQSLKLKPNEADVLNYLGYSWVDQNLNLGQAMQLIRQAVKLKPNSGYYVDSLGWAHYRLGRYKKAVKFLEKAVVLRPDDPVINDHLGDVYWRVGRQLEAKYQWKHALTLNPEKELIEQLNDKLKNGLKEKRQALAPDQK